MCRPIAGDNSNKLFPVQDKIQCNTKNETTSISSYVKSSLPTLTISIILLYLSFSNTIYNPSFSSEPISQDPNSVYVPGAGFSGFWFTLGRLKSIKRPYEKNYYCFSAGCLGVVSLLTNSSVHDMIDYASSAQRLWKEGEISRYEVASNFIDKLIPSEEDPNSTLVVKDLILDRINIITTTFGIGVNIRRPKNTKELREMLIQTTWIPFATGSGITKIDQNGYWHLDGGFSLPFHPTCQSYLNLPFKFDLILNILNPSLSIEKALEFWRDGLAYDS